MRWCLALIALTACSSDKPGLERQIPHDVKAGYAAACKADTATLRAMADTGGQPAGSPLHDIARNGDGYTITIVDARCGVVGHAVGDTPTDY